MSQLLETALAYAGRLGWAVFPVHGIEAERCTCGNPACERPGKHPRTPRGFQDATRDEAQIRQWWGWWPNASIGIATGERSGIIALDFDPKLGGLIARDDMADQFPELGETLAAQTGSGGFHHVFRYVPGVGCRVQLEGRGVDVRGDGGYIIAAPSRHASGQCYQWLDCAEDVPEADQILAMPPGLVDVVGLRAQKDAGAQFVELGEAHIPMHEHAKLCSALKAVRPVGDTWWKVGMAIHEATGGSRDGFELWEAWAKSEPTYASADPRAHLKRWRSFHSNRTDGLSLASVYAMARASGWIWSENCEFIIDTPARTSAEYRALMEKERIAKALETYTIPAPAKSPIPLADTPISSVQDLIFWHDFDKVESPAPEPDEVPAAPPASLVEQFQSSGMIHAGGFSVPICRPEELPPVASVGEFIDNNKDDRLLPESFWRGGVLFRHCLFVLAGEPKSGKSATFQALAMAAACGGEFLGHPFPKPLRVLWLQAEIHSGYLAKRLEAMMENYPIEQRALIRANLLTTGRMNLDLMNDRDFGWIMNLVEKHKPDIICIDPLANFSTANENDNSEARQVMTRCMALGHIGKGAAVVLIHHTNKSAGKNAAAGESPFDGIRGAGAIRGAYDSCMVLVRNPKGERVAYYETRNAESPAEHGIAIDVGAGTVRAVALEVERTKDGTHSGVKEDLPPTLPAIEPRKLAILKWLKGAGPASQRAFEDAEIEGVSMGQKARRNYFKTVRIWHEVTVDDGRVSLSDAGRTLVKAYENQAGRA